MANVQDLLRVKGSQVMTIGKEATVLEAAHLMNDRKIGALVVTESGQVIGMFTERDVLRRVVGQERSPGQTKVVEVMSSQFVLEWIGRLGRFHQSRHWFQ